MAGIYIPNAKLPSGIAKLIISADGQVYFVDYINPYRVLPEKAISIPDHGDLIERDAAVQALKPADCVMEKEPELTWGEIWAEDCCTVDHLPTIIPADKTGV